MMTNGWGTNYIRALLLRYSSSPSMVYIARISFFFNLHLKQSSLLLSFHNLSNYLKNESANTFPLKSLTETHVYSI